MRPSLTEQKIKRVVVIGGGTAGWMSAAALVHKLGGQGVSVTLIESKQIGTVGVGEATLPHIRFFNQMLGLNEAEMMAKTCATIKLGIEFCDWGRIGERYIHPFGRHGVDIGPADFHHYWIKQNLRGNVRNFDSFCYPIICARRGRFALPEENPQSELFAYSYAYQFDAHLYGNFLSSYAKDKGVRHLEGIVVAVNRQSETGFVTSVQLDSGESVEGDLFVDCSGFRGLLINQALGIEFDDWSQFLPCNRAFAVPSAALDNARPYTRATARSAGWQWRIPLQHRVGNGLVYCDAFIDDDEAQKQLLSSLDSAPLSDPKQLFFKAGKRHKLWSKNCVAIGLAGGFLEPLESTSIDLIQSGISNLLALFPQKSCDPTDIDAYNQLMDSEFERIRDFLILHYVANQREEDPFWQELRNMERPDSLNEKIEAFTTRGLVPQYSHGLFAPPSWLSVFIGQGAKAARYDPRVDLMDERDLSENLDRIHSMISKRVDATPTHHEFLKTYGAIADEAEKVSEIQGS